MGNRSFAVFPVLIFLRYCLEAWAEEDLKGRIQLGGKDPQGTGARLVGVVDCVVQVRNNKGQRPKC